MGSASLTKERRLASFSCCRAGQQDRDNLQLAECAPGRPLTFHPPVSVFGRAHSLENPRHEMNDTEAALAQFLANQKASRGLTIVHTAPTPAAAAASMSANSYTWDASSRYSEFYQQVAFVNGPTQPNMIKPIVPPPHSFMASAATSVNLTMCSGQVFIPTFPPVEPMGSNPRSMQTGSKRKGTKRKMDGGKAGKSPTSSLDNSDLQLSTVVDSSKVPSELDASCSAPTQQKKKKKPLLTAGARNRVQFDHALAKLQARLFTRELPDLVVSQHAKDVMIMITDALFDRDYDCTANRVLFNAKSNNEAAATAVYQASKAAARNVTLQSVFKVSGVPMNRIGTLQRDLQRQLTEKHEDYQLPSEAQKLMDAFKEKARLLPKPPTNACLSSTPEVQASVPCTGDTEERKSRDNGSWGFPATSADLTPSADVSTPPSKQSNHEITQPAADSLAGGPGFGHEIIDKAIANVPQYIQVLRHCLQEELADEYLSATVQQLKDWERSGILNGKWPATRCAAAMMCVLKKQPQLAPNLSNSDIAKATGVTVITIQRALRTFSL